MRVGMIGLGKMGNRMARRLLNGGHQLVVHDQSEESVADLVEVGATGCCSIHDLVINLPVPRVIWVMVPPGNITDLIIRTLGRQLTRDDVIVDGGNSHYQETIRHAKWLRRKGIHLMDVGTSGGIWGMTEGYTLMIGGELNIFNRIKPIFQTLAPRKDRGFGLVGPVGSGHFVKMIHNGIEYGLMQAYAEGFELLRAKKEFQLDAKEVAEIWRYGSVIRSWLLDLTAAALQNDPDLTSIQAYVDDTGEGRWAVEESIRLAVPIPIIALSLQSRFRSRQEQPFSNKLLAAMRDQFGGHGFKKVE